MFPPEQVIGYTDSRARREHPRQEENNTTANRICELSGIRH